MKLFYLLLFFPIVLFSQTAEPQKSFAQEEKPLEYYIEQSKLWKIELEKDSTSEQNWYNYFRACRNAFGKNDWNSSIYSKSKYVMNQDEILEGIKRNCPDSFTYYYISYLKNGIGTENADEILKAYELNPNFEGIHSSVISYAESKNDYELRRKVNSEWAQQNNIADQLLDYSYNMLMSTDTNAILFVQNDNDTYPTYLLQDVYNIRNDVLVINIDFLLLDNYREFVFKKLDLENLTFGEIDSDEYHVNWERVLKQILDNYKGERKLHLSMTLYNHLYQDYSDDLHIVGLTLMYSKEKVNTVEQNKKFYEELFLLDSLSHNFSIESNQKVIDIQNFNYVNMLIDIYNSYKVSGLKDDSESVKKLALKVTERIGKKDLYNNVVSFFE